MKIFIFTIVISFIFQEQLNDLLFNFTKSKTITNWVIIDDGVMGGLSKGNIKLNKNGNGVFSGTISTDNNGGFSLLKHQFNIKKVQNYKRIALRVKGDKKSYQFRIKSSKQDYYSFVAMFSTSGAWETIVFSFNDFEPQFRGRFLDKPNYDGETMEEIAFLIGNKTNEEFQLEIKSIKLLK